jgi:DNA-directed RNA polymerase specialized sigma24 family protein
VTAPVATVDVAQLFRDHHGNVRAVIRKQYGPDLADDSTAFAFLQAAAGKLAADHPEPGAWLVQVARNEAFRLHRKSRRTLHLDGFTDEDGEERQVDLEAVERGSRGDRG